MGITAEPLTAEQKAKIQAEAAKEEQEEKEKEKAAAAQAVADEAAAEAARKAAEPSTEDKIKAIVNGELLGKTNSDKGYLREVNVSTSGSQRDVQIKFNANDNLTSNLVQVGIRSKMSDLYYKLYNSKLPISSVTISAYLSLTDKYGNQADDIVYTTILKSDEAEKVNWKAEEFTVKSIVLPQLWSTTYIDPAIAVE